jgi:hypothetical protein
MNWEERGISNDCLMAQSYHLARHDRRSSGNALGAYTTLEVNEYRVSGVI